VSPIGIIGIDICINVLFNANVACNINLSLCLGVCSSIVVLLLLPTPFNIL